MSKWGTSNGSSGQKSAKGKLRRSRLYSSGESDTRPRRRGGRNGPRIKRNPNGRRRRSDNAQYPDTDKLDASGTRWKQDCRKSRPSTGRSEIVERIQYIRFLRPRGNTEVYPRMERAHQPSRHPQGQTRKDADRREGQKQYMRMPDEGAGRWGVDLVNGGLEQIFDNATKKE